MTWKVYKEFGCEKAEPLFEKIAQSENKYSKLSSKGLVACSLKRKDYLKLRKIFSTI